MPKLTKISQYSGKHDILRSFVIYFDIRKNKFSFFFLSSKVQAGSDNIKIFLEEVDTLTK